MSRHLFRASCVLVFMVVLAASALPSESRNVPTRHSSGSAGSGGHAAAPSGGRNVPVHTPGQGPYHGHGGYYPYYPYYPYYGSYYWGWPYWSLGVWWGWPGYWYDGWGYYGQPGYYPGDYPGYDETAGGPAYVLTDVRPKKAEVVLDGEAIGEAHDFNGTWDVLTLGSGRHDFKFQAPGYMTLEVTVDARVGRRYKLAYDLRRGEGKDPRSEALTAPPAAPASAPSMPGSAPPAASSSGTPGERPASGVARGFLKVVVSPPDAAVYLDGEFLGRGDELARLHGALPVATGEHRIEVVRPGYLSRTNSVTVGDGSKPTEVRIDLQREGGSTL